MIALLITLLALCALALPIAIYFAFDWVREWLHARDVVRRSANEQQLKTMRAAQQLAVMSWQAHRQLRDLMQEQSKPQPISAYRAATTKYNKS